MLQCSMIHYWLSIAYHSPIGSSLLCVLGSVLTSTWTLFTSNSVQISGWLTHFLAFLTSLLSRPFEWFGFDRWFDEQFSSDKQCLFAGGLFAGHRRFGLHLLMLFLLLLKLDMWFSLKTLPLFVIGCTVWPVEMVVHRSLLVWLVWHSEYWLRFLYCCLYRSFDDLLRRHTQQNTDLKPDLNLEKFWSEKKFVISSRIF